MSSLGIVVKCFQSERSSRQFLQFLRPTHQNFNFISIFGLIFCLFFMTRKKFSHKRSALTASFRVRQPPNAPFVLSYPSVEPRLSCGCHGAVVSSTSLQVPSLHVAEYMVVDVAVQLLQPHRAAESRIHLQEQQGHFPSRSEERPASQLRPHAFHYQTEVLCHLAEREQFRILPNSLFSKVE